MAIQLNPYSKTGIITAMTLVPGMFSSSASFRIFPSTVAFPSSPINTTGSTPAGHILSYSTLTYTLTGNTITITAGTTSANATAAGTLAWWALVGQTSGTGDIISDSIGLSGSGAILTVNTLTPTNGQSVSITFNFTLAA